MSFLNCDSNLLYPDFINLYLFEACLNTRLIIFWKNLVRPANVPMTVTAFYYTNIGAPPKNQVREHRFLKHRLQKHQLFTLKHRLHNIDFENIDCKKDQLNKIIEFENIYFHASVPFLQIAGLRERQREIIN
jgi:hypothetical protein